MHSQIFHAGHKLSSQAEAKCCPLCTAKCSHKKVSKSCVPSKEQYRSLTSHTCIQYKVTLQLKPTQTSSSTYRHGSICLPTCSPRLLRMLDSSMVQSPDLSCLPAGVKPRCTALFQPPAPSLPQAKSDLSSC